MLNYSNYRRLSIYFLGFSVIIFLLLCIILFNIFYIEQKDKIILDTSLKLDLIATQSKINIQNTFENYIHILEQMAKNPSIILMNEDGKGNFEFAFNNYSNFIKAVTRVDSLGRIIYTYPENPKVIGQNISNQKHIYKLLITQKPVISEVFFAVQGYNAIAIHVPVFNGKRFSGSVAFVLDFTLLSQKFLKDITFGYNNKPILLSKSGIILFSKNKDTVGKNILESGNLSNSQKQFYKDMIIGKEGFFTININDKNNSTLIAYVKKIELSDTYWSIAITIPENEVLKDINSFKNKLLVIFVVLFIGGVTFVYFITKAWGIINKDAAVKEYVKKLEESEKRYKTLFEDYHTVKILIDPETLNIVNANEAAAKFYGYTKEELLKLKITDINLNPPEKVKSDINNTVNNTTAYYQFKYVLKDGTIKDVEIHAGLINYENKQYVYANIFDATEKRKAEAEIIKAKEEAEKASRLKDAFIANISHEIRTPLNGILGMTSLLKESLNEYIGDDEKEFFNGIDRASKRIIRTIDMIVNYSRFQVGDFPYNPNYYDMDILLTNIFKECKNSFESKNLRLEYSNKAGKTILFIDEYSIQQAINNLLDNAEKFTNEGFVKLTLYKNMDGNVCLDIMDTGVGISEEYLPNLFKPYTQEEIGYNRRFEGIGLGLSLVKKYLDLNNCIITVTSKKDYGTTFTIIFPPKK